MFLGFLGAWGWDTMVYPAFASCASPRPRASVCREPLGHGEGMELSKRKGGVLPKQRDKSAFWEDYTAIATAAHCISHLTRQYSLEGKLVF